MFLKSLILLAGIAFSTSAEARLRIHECRANDGDSGVVDVIEDHSEGFRGRHVAGSQSYDLGSAIATDRQGWYAFVTGGHTYYWDSKTGRVIYFVDGRFRRTYYCN